MAGVVVKLEAFRQEFCNTLDKRQFVCLFVCLFVLWLLFLCSSSSLKNIQWGRVVVVKLEAFRQEFWNTLDKRQFVCLFVCFFVWAFVVVFVFFIFFISFLVGEGGGGGCGQTLSISTRVLEYT